MASPTTTPAELDAEVETNLRHNLMEMPAASEEAGGRGLPIIHATWLVESALGAPTP